MDAFLVIVLGLAALVGADFYVLGHEFRKMIKRQPKQNEAPASKRDKFNCDEDEDRRSCLRYEGLDRQESKGYQARIAPEKGLFRSEAWLMPFMGLQH